MFVRLLRDSSNSPRCSLDQSHWVEPFLSPVIDLNLMNKKVCAKIGRHERNNKKKNRTPLTLMIERKLMMRTLMIDMKPSFLVETHKTLHS